MNAHKLKGTTIANLINYHGFVKAETNNLDNLQEVVEKRLIYMKIAL